VQLDCAYGEEGLRVVGGEVERVRAASSPGAPSARTLQHVSAFAEDMLRELEGKDLRCAYDLMTRGNCYQVLGRYEEALADYDAAVADEPGHEGGMCWFNRGNALLALARREEAADSFRQATKHPIGATQSVVWTNLAHVLSTLGRHDEALAVLDEYIRRVSDSGGFGASPAQAFLYRGQVLREKGDLEGAASAYRRSVELEPDDPVLLFRAGDHFLMFGDPTEALHFYALYEASSHDRPIALARKAFALHRAGRTEDAVTAWRAAVELDASVEPWAREWCTSYDLEDVVAAVMDAVP
jgi:tetratricopeptide (TPR) repeat protein